MARAKSRARQREFRYYTVGVLLFLFAIAIAGFAVYLYVKSENNLPDPVTLCPADGPKGHYVLLVDNTDPLTFTQKEAFSVILSELIERRTPEGYLLSIFVLGEYYKENAKPMVELCNPGTSAEKSQWTADLKTLRKQYETQFIAPLRKQSEALLTTQSAKVSPILEMLQLVSINAFHKRDVKGERRLFIVSDMLHNTPEYSMYKGPTDYAAFASTAYGKKSQLELRNVEVEIHYLMNTPQLQTKRNLKFWEDHFNKAGARIVAVRPLEG